jgi:hypothetical protein
MALLNFKLVIHEHLLTKLALPCNIFIHHSELSDLGFKDA